MTQLEEHTEQRQALTERAMKRAATELLDRLSDRVHEVFPWDGKADTEQHVELYEAMGSALAAVRGVLVGSPAHDEFRRTVFGFVKEAWELTDGAPKYDDAITQAIVIAERDNKPETPEQIRRKRDAASATKGADKVQSSSKAGPK